MKINNIILVLYAICHSGRFPIIFQSKCPCVFSEPEKSKKCHTKLLEYLENHCEIVSILIYVVSYEWFNRGL